MTKTPFEYQETVDDLFTFVNTVILPSMVDYERYGDFLFRLDHSDKHDASVQLLGKRFRVSINTGLVNELVYLIESDLAAENGVLQIHVAELKSTTLPRDALLNLILVSSIVFVLLHEVYHAIGGHSEYCSDQVGGQCSATHTMRESTLLSMSGAGAGLELSVLMELEADGGAYATTLEFSRQIFATVTDAFPFPEQHTHWVDRSVILGSLSALAVLQEMVPVDRASTDARHFPSIRILNACSANYRSMAAPQYSRMTNDPYVPMDLEEGEANAVGERYAQTILPAIIMLDSMLAQRYGTFRFLERSAADDAIFDSPYMLDIRSLLGGLTPRQSPAGRTFAKHVQSRVEFMRRLAPYRRADLW